MNYDWARKAFIRASEAAPGITSKISSGAGGMRRVAGSRGVRRAVLGAGVGGAGLYGYSRYSSARQGVQGRSSGGSTGMY